MTLDDFKPGLPWWGGDLQTIGAYFVSRFPRLPLHPFERLLLPIDDGSGDSLVAALHRQETGRDRPLVVLIHGLAGCEESCYMVATAAYLLGCGFPVLRLNLRGAGPSRLHCRREYHAGSTAELHAAIQGLDPDLRGRGLLAIGFSLGGNILLKYLAEYRGHTPVLAAASISAPIDLADASRCLLRWRNTFYQRHLLAGVKRSTTLPRSDLTAKERAAILAARSIHEFDHAFTAPRNGYPDADRFYEANAAQRFLDAIRTPTLLIHARDDPFVPATAYERVEWRRLPYLTALLPRSGGHLGFRDPTGLWLLGRILGFFRKHTY